VAEPEDVSARLDALARQLRTTRSIALVLAVAVAASSAWTIYIAVHKPEKITLSSNAGTLTLSPIGITLKTHEHMPGGILVETTKTLACPSTRP
jgi:hypothetical protein